MYACLKSIHLINQVFRRKNLVMKMMNVGGRVGGRSVGRADVNNSFPEHNSATVRNILMIFGRIIEQISAKCRVQERQLCLSFFSNYFP